MSDRSRVGVAVSAEGRIQILDTLRGFALFGVLIVNMQERWLGQPLGSLDRIAHGFVSLVFQYKAWPLLSLLFGLGFAIQIERARAKGTSVVWIHLRRMLALYGFGIVLMVLFLGNPILIRYAALGILLLPFASLPPRWVITSAALFFLIATCDWAVYEIYQQRNPPAQIQQQSPAPPSLTDAALGEFREATRGVLHPGWWVGRQAELFTMFLVGLYVGKRKLYANLDERREMLWRVLKWSLPLGLAGTIGAFFWIVDDASASLVRRVLHYVPVLAGGDLQGIGYGVALSLSALSAPSAAWVRLLAWCGRMPLTNYLAQWLLMRLIFDRFFLGLGGKVGSAAGILIALGVFCLQLGWSQWWFKRVQFGPVEWIWKTLTYMRIQPMRLRHVSLIQVVADKPIEPRRDGQRRVSRV